MNATTTHTLTKDFAHRIEFTPVLSTCRIKVWNERRCRQQRTVTVTEAREYWAELVRKGWTRF